jgi:hypothetical protein
LLVLMISKIEWSKWKQGVWKSKIRQMYKLQWTQQITVSCKMLCPHLLFIYKISTDPCQHVVVSCFIRHSPVFIYDPGKTFSMLLLSAVNFFRTLKINFIFIKFLAHLTQMVTRGIAITWHTSSSSSVRFYILIFFSETPGTW